VNDVFYPYQQLPKSLEEGGRPKIDSLVPLMPQNIFQSIGSATFKPLAPSGVCCCLAVGVGTVVEHSTISCSIEVRILPAAKQPQEKNGRGEIFLLLYLKFNMESWPNFK
jgi:hypothetical protein